MAVRARVQRLLRRLTKWILLCLPSLVKTWLGETWPRGIGQRSRRPRYHAITRTRVPAGFFGPVSAKPGRSIRCKQVACVRRHVPEGERADGATAVHRIVRAGDIVFGPGQASVCHTIPMSLDGGIAGTEAEEYVRNGASPVQQKCDHARGRTSRNRRHSLQGYFIQQQCQN